MQNWVILPLLIPLLIGLSSLIRRRAFRRRAFLIGTFANMLFCLWLLYSTQGETVLVTQVGGHPAPFGISLVVDSLSAFMLSITAVVSFAIGIYATVTIDANRERFAFFPLTGFLVMGINFAFLTGDLFTLYVAFEVMLMSSFVLLTLGGERGQIEGGLKYVTLNLISSTVFLAAAGLTYAAAGTLNMAQLAERLAGQPSPGLTTVLAGLFLIVFGIKGAIFPLFFWLPASYHTPPVALTALFGGLLTKIGIYAMWRVLAMMFPQDVAFFQPLLLVLAALTMIVGVLGAIAQNDFRRLLSFHIISQIGYLLMGLALFTVESMTASVFFMFHVILAKTALFMVSGIANAIEGTYELKKLGGLQQTHPRLALIFLLAALGLAGTPPLSGFWAKYLLLRAGVEAGQYGIVAVALVVSLLTFYSMIKIWNEVFWKKPPEIQQPVSPFRMRWMMGSTALLAALVVLIGVLVEPVTQLSRHIAEGITSPATYIDTVLMNDGEGE